LAGGEVGTSSAYAGGGKISIDVSTLEARSGGEIYTIGAGGGDISIKASKAATLMEDSWLSAWSGGSIRMVTPELTVDRSNIVAKSDVEGVPGGDIDILVDRLILASGSIGSNIALEQKGGNISILARDQIELKKTDPEETPEISSTTLFDGNAGNITISTPKLIIDNGSVTSGTFGSGRGGDITINVDQLVLQNGGWLSSSTGSVGYGTGQGGAITVNAAKSVTLVGNQPDGFQMPSTIEVASYGEGQAGNITIATPRLELNGGSIDAGTYLYSKGNAGSISINTDGLSLVDGASIEVINRGPGAPGNLEVKAGAITIDGGGDFDSRTGIFSEAWGTGGGGDIRITADRLDLTGQSWISASSWGSSNAGSLDINLTDALRLSNSTIQTQATLSAGGNINLHVGNLLWLQNSNMGSSANGVTPTDSGGNLSISTPQFLILNQSGVWASANAGNGGNISLAADYFLQSADSIINASSQKGLDGQIVIDSPNEVTGTVAVLDAPPLDISELLGERCAAAALRERSSFTVEGRGGLPPRPGDLLQSPLPNEESSRKKKIRGEIEKSNSSASEKSRVRR
jgi:large exoprotein involved in heme utilization and adhesion